MPTAKPRHLITETDQVSRALDDAARRWPQDKDKRSKLLLHLVAEGHQALLDETDARRRARQAAIERTHGALAGTYEPDYLVQLREDWPQ